MMRLGNAAAGLVLAVAGALLPTVPAWSATGTRTSAFEYDPASGLLTREIIEPGTQQLRLETAYTYDAFGNKTAATVTSPATGEAAIAPRTATATFDAQGRFATAGANALNHTETRAFDARFGGATGLTGPNSLTTQWQYDAFGRRTLEIRADGTRTKWEYFYCTGVHGGTMPCALHAKYLVLATPLASDGVTQNGPVLYIYFDGLGRETSRLTQGFNGVGIVSDFKSYDSRGHIERVSAPYFGADGPVWTTFLYDVLGRVIRENQPDNSYTTFTYDGLLTTAINSQNQTRTETRNSQGQVAAVQDAGAGTTTFAYDPFGKLTRTTDAAGNVSTMTYDTRGRKVAMSDPNTGSWTYVYDVVDQLVRQTDAKTQVTTFTHDLLGRMTGRAEPDLTSSWTWDTAVKGIGKLAAAVANNGYQRQHAYDSLSRPSLATITIDATTSSIGTTYDGHGRIDTVTYPSGFAVKHVYTGLGYLSEVRHAATNALFWRVNAMNAELQLTSATHGNNVGTTQTYHPQTRRITAIQAGTGASVANFSYEWDTLGNLHWRKDLNQNLEEIFTYDPLNRLIQAAVEGGPAKSYLYDAIGNITFKSDTGTYAYPAPGSPRPHAVSSISGSVNTSFTYDANGNLLSGNGRTLTWTSFNMPATIARGGNTVSFAYDSEHGRIRQVAPDGTTLYVNDPGSGVRVEKFTGSGGLVRWNNYIWAHGGIVAVFFETVAGTNPSSTRYFHKDHLGSIAVITDEAGAVVERLSYDPWGKRRFPNGTDDPGDSITSLTDRGFTGHEHLQEVGLVHMNGRIYDPLVARFMSADPFIQDPFDSQSLNRYSYVGNNPLANTDPNGFFLKKLFKGITRALFGKSGLFSHVADLVSPKQLLRLVATAVAFELGGPFGAILSSAFFTAVDGGSIGDILKSAALAFVSDAAFGGFVGDSDHGLFGLELLRDLGVGMANMGFGGSGRAAPRRPPSLAASLGRSRPAACPRSEEQSPSYRLRAAPHSPTAAKSSPTELIRSRLHTFSAFHPLTRDPRVCIKLRPEIFRRHHPDMTPGLGGHQCSTMADGC